MTINTYLQIYELLYFIFSRRKDFAAFSLIKCKFMCFLFLWKFLKNPILASNIFLPG